MLVSVSLTLSLFKKSDQCDACRNYRDGPFCVPTCPRDDVTKRYKYPDDNRVCQECHANCIDGCNGPENTVGPKGCNLCKVSVAKADRTGVDYCLNETEACPSGYYSTGSLPKALSHLKGEKVRLVRTCIFSYR